MRLQTVDEQEVKGSCSILELTTTKNGGTASCRSAVFFGSEEEDGRGRKRMEEDSEMMGTGIGGGVRGLGEDERGRRGWERDSEVEGRGLGGGRKRTERMETGLGEDRNWTLRGRKRELEEDDTRTLRSGKRDLEKDGNGTFRRRKKGNRESCNSIAVFS